MDKYIVTIENLVRHTRRYEVWAESAEDADDLAYDNQGTLISEHTKNIDGDSSVERVE
jgi:hypothetical protein